MNSKELVLIVKELDNAAIRRTADGRLSVFDALKASGAKNPWETIKRIDSAYPNDHILTKCEFVKLRQANGRMMARPTPVADIDHIIRILALLPNDAGKKVRDALIELASAFNRADLAIADSVISRSEDLKGLKQLEGKLRDRIKLVEGKDYIKFFDGVCDVDPCSERFGEIGYIARHEMSDIELLRAGIPPCDIASQCFNPEGINAIAQFLGLIPVGEVDDLHEIQKARIKDEPGHLEELLEELSCYKR